MTPGAAGGGGGGDDDWIQAPRPYLDHLRPGAEPERPGAGSEGPGPGADPAGVRPYLLTGGRSTIRRDLNVETMVTATGARPRRPLDDDHLRLLRLLAEPTAVAELAALSGIPIGVAMILAGDLSDAGVVTLHDASGGGSASPADNAALLRKVVNGVLKLRDAEAR